MNLLQHEYIMYEMMIEQNRYIEQRHVTQQIKDKIDVDMDNDDRNTRPENA